VSKPRDYYAILGVPRDASPEDIKKAYRRMAMRYHPDRAQDEPGAEDKFKEAAEAYSVLGDSARRSEYDQHGSVGGFDPSTVPFDVASIQEMFGDILGDLFKSRRKKKPSTRGRDLRYDLRVDLGEAATGSEKELRVPRKVRCRTCQGSGARPGSRLETCSTCQGSGEMKLQQGFFSAKRPCSYCHGQGNIIKDPCRTCFGTGYSEAEQVLSVRIPAGVADGQRLKVAGKGEEGRNGGEPGDLFVQVQIEAHPLFQRDGLHLRCEIPVSAAEAVLGTQVDVPTLDGLVRMRIPAGTQSGRAFRLAQKGMPPLGKGERGDLFVTVAVEIPAEPSAQERAQYEALLELEPASLPRRAAYRKLVLELSERGHG